MIRLIATPQRSAYSGLMPRCEERAMGANRSHDSAGSWATLATSAAICEPSSAVCRTVGEMGTGLLALKPRVPVVAS
eukprot:scaffold3138_cov60-Phaeocystis_antarctica.AAC.2